jgi:hypothetical protein
VSLELDAIAARDALSDYLDAMTDDPERLLQLAGNMADALAGLLGLSPIPATEGQR